MVDILAALASQLEHTLLQAMATTGEAPDALSAIAGKGQALKIVVEALLFALEWRLMLPLPPSTCCKHTNSTNDAVNLRSYRLICVFMIAITASLPLKPCHTPCVSIKLMVMTTCRPEVCHAFAGSNEAHSSI